MSTTTFKKISRKSVSLNKYSGKWVAFDENEKIIAWADTLEELDEKVKKLRLPKGKEPSYFLVPRKDEGPYILYVRI